MFERFTPPNKRHPLTGPERQTLPNRDVAALVDVDGLLRHVMDHTILNDHMLAIHIKSSLSSALQCPSPQTLRGDFRKHPRNIIKTWLKLLEVDLGMAKQPPKTLKNKAKPNRASSQAYILDAPPRRLQDLPVVIQLRCTIPCAAQRPNKSFSLDAPPPHQEWPIKNCRTTRVILCTTDSGK